MNDNLPEVLAAYKAYEAKVDIQLGLAANEIGLRLEGLAKNQIKGRRPEGEKAVSGQPPMNRTGNLRRSIIGFGTRQGFGSYAAIVGAQMIYARPVEIGDPYNPPTWRNGERFPFIAPAVEQFLKTGQLQSVIAKYMRMIK